MNHHMRVALIALAVLGVYLFGVMTGAVGLPLAHRVASAVFGGGAARVAAGPGMMGGWESGRAPDGRVLPEGVTPFEDCPHWYEDADSSQGTTVTPGPRPFGRGMVPPGTWRR